MPAKRLGPGSRVRVLALSSPVQEEPFEAGCEVLRSWGLELQVPDSVFADLGYLAGDPALRRGELEAALADPEVDWIWAARGGSGASDALEGISPKLVAKAGKGLVGFSDPTALHALWARAGLGSLHAGNLSGLARWSPEALEELRLFCFQGQPPSFSGERWDTHPDPLPAPIRGGNLTVLESLVGTPAMPSFTDCLVFLEDVGERPYRLDRSLVHLRQAGVFEGARGILLGQFTDCEDPPEKASGRTWRDALERVLLPLGLPILAGLAVGHQRSSRCLPLGLSAQLVEERLELG